MQWIQRLLRSCVRFFRGCAQVMETANRATDVAATQRLVQNFAKQSYELDAKHEMMGEAIDGLDDLDDLEDEMDGVMDSVLAEIGINLATQACPPLPRVTLRLSRDSHSRRLSCSFPPCPSRLFANRARMGSSPRTAYSGGSRLYADRGAHRRIGPTSSNDQVISHLVTRRQAVVARTEDAPVLHFGTCGCRQQLWKATCE